MWWLSTLLTPLKVKKGLSGDSDSYFGNELWATIEHSLNYKYGGDFPEEIKKRLEVTAKIALELDEEMRKIREDIREAQLLFDPVTRNLSDGVGNSDDTDELYR